MVSRGGDVVAARLEVVVDLAVPGEETLRVAGRFEPLHLPFSLSRGLVRHIGPIEEMVALPVLHPGQNVALRCGADLHLVRDAYMRGTWQALRQLAEEPLRRQAATCGCFLC